MKFSRKNVNPLIGSEQQIKCVFNPHRSFPFKIKGHDCNIEYGLYLKPKKMNYWLSSKIVMMMLVTIIATMLPFWWLNSDASIEESLPTSKNILLKTTNTLGINKLNLSVPTPVEKVEKLDLPIPTTAGIKELDLSNPEFLPKLPSLPWLHITVKPGDTLSRIFARYRLNTKQLYKIIKLPKYAHKLRQLHINQELHVKQDINRNIEDIILILNKTNELHIYRIDKEFKGEIRRIGVHTERVFVRGIVENSLSEAAKKIGLSETMLSNLAEVFQWDIDFDRQVQPGDQFNVIYEQFRLEGDIEEGDILAAEFVNKGQVYQALRYTSHSGSTEYYTPTGDSLRKISILNAPVQYKRISSYFGDRKHPVLNRVHFHTGIDYAAPWGRPIVAAGEGTIKFLGRKGGYGKTIVLQHNTRLRTLYAHLWKFTEELKIGDEVAQGQIIGYVGQSGRATGPHLHYEILFDGEYQDPHLINSPISMPIPEKYQAYFFKKTQKLMTQLDTLKSLKPTKVAQDPRLQFTPTTAKLAQIVPVESALMQHSIPYSEK
ncbi:M23 family metallopeptidase [Candidatus Parabeggiatoa sp. HSG14]|uniref:M23 family metallopeptidase n=1 Tax=Candidatus Parabeggiatoa sp. HSG14 TaxID=3055593 RepID=UPI0025A6BDB0|nr:M23 family metallopeptidase [Thiotrichales bacterium HSG14]